MIAFEWDPEKAQANLRKHGVTFTEAVSVFRNPLSCSVFDPDHSSEEDRFITIGISRADRILVVAHTERRVSIRIISARKATRKERKAYEDEIKSE